MDTSSGCMSFGLSVAQRFTSPPRFPLQEYGMNYKAQPLQKHELAALKTDLVVRERLLRSYSTMLGFYGMQLVSPETGEIRRADNWQERYRNLTRKCFLVIRSATSTNRGLAQVHRTTISVFLGF